MPEQTTPPANVTQGEPTPTTETVKVTETTTGQFSQDQVNQTIQDRLARVKPPEDYEEAKAALEAQRKREEGEKTELEKAKEDSEAAQRERDEARSEIAAVRRQSAIMLEAFQQGADAEMVVLALEKSPDIKVTKDGQVEGVKEAVAALLERKPNLKVGGPTASSGHFGGAETSTVAEEIAALEREGTAESIRKARDLKIGQMITSG